MAQLSSVTAMCLEVSREVDHAAMLWALHDEKPLFDSQAVPESDVTLPTVQAVSPIPVISIAARVIQRARVYDAVAGGQLQPLIGPAQVLKPSKRQCRPSLHPPTVYLLGWFSAANTSDLPHVCVQASFEREEFQCRQGQRRR